jgi:hypothetical protein
MTGNPETYTEDEIRAHHVEVQGGPYRWAGDLDARTLRIVDPHGDPVVGFTRWSQQGGVPTFPRNGHQRGKQELMMRATDAAVLDPQAGHGVIVDIDETHARYLARSWAYIDVLLGMVEDLRAQLASPADV